MDTFQKYFDEIIDTMDMVIYMIIGPDAITHDKDIATAVALINTINRHEVDPIQTTEELYDVISAEFDIPRDILANVHLKFRYDYAYQYDQFNFIVRILDKLPTDENGNTPLHQATIAGAQNIVKELVKNSVNIVTARNNAGKTALMLAKEIRLSENVSSNPAKIEKFDDIISFLKSQTVPEEIIPEYAQMPWPRSVGHRNFRIIMSITKRLREMPVGTIITFGDSSDKFKKISNSEFILNENSQQIFEFVTVTNMLDTHGVTGIILP